MPIQDEMDQAPMQILRWSSWVHNRGRPAGLLLAAFWPNNTVPGAPVGAAAGPRLAAANVPGVNVTVTAHRRSPDEHIKVIGESPDSLLDGPASDNPHRSAQFIKFIWPPVQTRSAPSMLVNCKL